MQATSFVQQVFRGFSAKLLILALSLTTLIAQESSTTATTASVRITRPFDGQEFLPGGFINFEVEAFSPNGVVDGDI